jgi:hypothetical protein
MGFLPRAWAGVMAGMAWFASCFAFLASTGRRWGLICLALGITDWGAR